MQRKPRLKNSSTSKHPQKAPKNNYFSNLMKTEEGRQLRKQWSNKPRKNPGRPKGVPDGYTRKQLNQLEKMPKSSAEDFVSKKDIKNRLCKRSTSNSC